MITPHTPCGAQRNDFGMRTGIMLADIAIPTFTKQHSVGADNHRAYRDFIVFVACTRSQRQRMLHPMDIVSALDLGALDLGAFAHELLHPPCPKPHA